MEIAFQVELELGIVSFCGGWKTGELGEKPSEEGRERTTNSAHIWRQVQESNLGQSSGSRALSQLRRPHSSFAQLFQPTRAIEKRSLNGVQGDVGPIDAVLCVIIVQRDDILQPTSKWNSCFSIVAEWDSPDEPSSSVK